MIPEAGKQFEMSCFFLILKSKSFQEPIFCAAIPKNQLLFKTKNRVFPVFYCRF